MAKCKPKSKPPSGPQSITLKGNILILAFNNANSLFLSLGRAHEHYERSKLNGPLRGINMPFEDLFHFVYCIGLHKLSVLELETWNSIQKQSPLYIIAHLSSDKSTLLHEWSHAIYHMDQEYRLFAQQLYTNLDPGCKKAVCHDLSLRRYDPERYIDEWQAYTVETPREFGKKWTPYLESAHLQLRSRIKPL